MCHVEANSAVGSEQPATQPTEKKMLTDVDVAARLGVSRFTVRSWRLKGQGPRFLKMGRAVRYRSQDVDDYERQAVVETHVQLDHVLTRAQTAEDAS